MVFFFCMTAQLVVSVLFVLGIWTIGILHIFPAFTNGGVFVGIVVIVATVVMAIDALGQLYIIVTVHRLYRGTGASVAKA